jgi:two-component system, response regulator
MANDVILLVEDNADHEELALLALEQYGHTDNVHVARDGEEVLDYLFATGRYAGRDSRQLPALVLLDVKLPKLDGLEVLRRLRADERTQVLPVVILSSSSEASDILTAYRLGANSYIRKPVDFTAFTAAVQQLGQYWLVLNEPVDML